MSGAASVATSRESFERDGYLIFDTGIRPDMLDGVVADLHGRYEPARVEGGVGYSPGRIQDAWRVSANVRAIALAPRILALLNELYGRRPLPFQTLNFAKGTEQAAHSDTLHFNATPAGFMCGVWVALEDMDMDVGPLVFYPGSHRLPEITLDDLGFGVRFRLSPLYERAVRMLRRAGFARSVVTPAENLTEALYARYYEPFLADLIERQRLEPRYATIRKGEALLWAANLLHGGAPQRDRTRTRHSQVTHYFFEGCRYYRPVLERRTATWRRRVCWMTPERIQGSASHG